MPQRKPEVTRRTAAGIPYELTRKKVKRLNLHIRRDGTVAVSIPWSYTMGFADAFVTEQAPWIGRRSPASCGGTPGMTSPCPPRRRHWPVLPP